MAHFDYYPENGNAEYYELLQQLIDRWKYEIVEFKEAKGQYSEDRIGQYFSAISNEANIAGQQFGWLVLGVSEENDKYPVGTSFKSGDPALLEKFKYTISRDTTDGMTFLDIIELFPIYEGKKRRVLMFKIPAAAAGMPTEWKTRYFGRDGDSLVPLQQYKIDLIRDQERRDWSKRIIARSGIEDLEPAAISIAREKYKEKMNRPHISEETDRLTDEEFLTKLRLMQDGKITYAALILLGKPESSSFFETPPTIMWRLLDKDGTVRDYELFEIPFIDAADRVLEKIRILTYRYLPNPRSIFTKEVFQYDIWSLRELISNCIAHSNYQSGGRIYINEFEDYLTITNPGTFIPGNIREVLQPSYNPPYYRNAHLAKAMANFRMIDTATSGIRKIFRVQKERFFPLPDYGMIQSYQVMVTVYGKTLNDQYTHILYNHPELDLETVYLLDQIQKGKNISEQDQNNLIEQKLIRIEDQHIYLADSVSENNDGPNSDTNSETGSLEKTDIKTDTKSRKAEKTDTKTDTKSGKTEKTDIKTNTKNGREEKTNTKNEVVR
ncbi:MAG: transcriptional regulator [Butyrivibrio sp.]|nr:ATP-binding protein [Butyrivibrio sp.]MBR1643693.1 transcriptional regulator [Butyrivibrio sp.]